MSLDFGTITEPPATTIEEFLRRLFPYGTIWPIEEQILAGGEAPRHDAAPSCPTDVFAAAATLLARSGALNRMVIGHPDGDTPASLREVFQAMADAVAAGGLDLNDETERRKLIAAGRAWTKGPTAPKLVDELWAKLLKDGSEPIYRVRKAADAFPAWWTHALGLVIISDEACEGVGYGPASNPLRYGRPESGEAADPMGSWVAGLFHFAFLKKNARAMSALNGGATAIIMSEGLPSLCLLADPDIVCVQPKVRTPAIGCTLRTYTHNIALVPPRGIVTTDWQHPPGRLVSEHSAPLNLLLVPYPYHLKARWFRGVRVKDVSLPRAPRHGTEPPRVPWGWFEVEQTWLRDEIVAFTAALIRTAEQDVGTIHGVLFPEFALDWPRFDHLQQSLMAAFPALEFVVAGSSSNCNGDNGNFVLSAVFLPARAGDNGSVESRAALLSSRSKHHRWRLDEAQISTYALASALDPRRYWWEAIPLGPREIDFTVFRTSSAFTTLICEDLARSDPCHAVLRDVGPNLVFVMLMDGPQLRDRWSARYSTTLADDPGCSVLTYTSLGLVERANMAAPYKQSRAVALWKDDTGKSVEIPCPPGAHGVVLSLSGYPVTEVTLDERSSDSAIAWRFHSQQPITIRPDGRKRLAAAIAAVTGGV